MADYWRLDKTTIGNDVYRLKKWVDSFYQSLSAGNDYKPEDMKTIEDLVKTIKGKAKKYKREKNEMKNIKLKSLLTEGKLKWKKLSSKEWEAEGKKYDFAIQKQGSMYALIVFDSKIKDPDDAVQDLSEFSSFEEATAEAEKWK